jgi:hypothetical protein
MPIIICGRFFFTDARVPTLQYALSSACFLTLQVLKITTSANSGLSQKEKPFSKSKSFNLQESCSFI